MQQSSPPCTAAAAGDDGDEGVLARMLDARVQLLAADAVVCALFGAELLS